MALTRRTRQLLPIALLLGVLTLALVVLLLVAQLRLSVPGAGPGTSAGAGTGVREHRNPSWPATGQAAISIRDRDKPVSSGPERPVPIASVTKIMTALIVLERWPLTNGGKGDDGRDGPTWTISSHDVADTERRRARSESIVEVRAGDQLSERQALLALLLASANNVAHLLAVQTAGSEPAFVDLMNAKAHDLRMSRTIYADASGFDPDSRSTARDQTVLARVAMQDPTFAWLVKQPKVKLPSAGVVSTTNRLLGHRGFVGMKTGSTSAAGGCFVFAARREVDGRSRLVVGAVLGQRGDDPHQAAFKASERLVDSVTDAVP